MSDHQLLALLVALGILVSLYGLIMTVQVHREVRETLLTSRTTLDAAVAILKKLNASA
jgi:hypothetical protein